MTRKTDKQSKQQEQYTKFIFGNEHNQENTQERYQRLLNEFDTKLKMRLIELQNKSTNQFNQDQINQNSDAIKNNEQRNQAIKTYTDCAENLKKLILSFSTKNDKAEFFSKTFLKKYADHEFLTEGGYPNDQFRIELLARAIETFDHPNDVTNQQQLLLLKEVLPDGAGYKLSIAATIAAFVLIGVGVAAIILPGPGILMLCLIVPAVLCLFGSQLLPMIGIAAQHHSENFNQFKTDIQSIPTKLKFFTQPEMDKNTPSNGSDDIVNKP